MIRENHIRTSARGQECTLNIEGVCNYNNETTVFAHISLPGGHGMGLKPDDLFGAYACSACHDRLDGRSNGLTKNSEDWLFYALRGVSRTLRILYEREYIKVVKGK